MNTDGRVQVLLMSNARLLLDQAAAPALTWVNQRNPWAPSDIASFLRFEGLSAGAFLSVTNPWGTVDITGETDACLKFQNRHVDPTACVCLDC